MRWWLALILAVVCFTLITLLVEFLVLQPENSPWFPSQFGGKPFVLDFAGILKLAVPAFFLLVAVLSLFRMNPRQVKRSAKAPGNPGALDPTAIVLPARSADSSVSEVVDFSDGLLRHMEWRRFEIVCAEYLRCLGYEVMETGFNKKDDVDLELYLPGKAHVFNVVQCKVWSYPMEVEHIKRFFQTMKSRGISEGMMFNVRGFSQKAVAYATRHRIALVDGETLCSRVRGLELEQRHALLEIATQGDYSTPTCPQCGIKMVVRRKKKRRETSEFWGCINAPQCKVEYPL